MLTPSESLTSAMGSSKAQMNKYRAPSSPRPFLCSFLSNFVIPMLHILDPMKILDTKGVLAVEFRKYYVRVVDYK